VVIGNFKKQRSPAISITFLLLLVLAKADTGYILPAQANQGKILGIIANWLAFSSQNYCLVVLIWVIY
jgi:hypothetical protein